MMKKHTNMKNNLKLLFGKPILYEVISSVHKNISNMKSKYFHRNINWRLPVLIFLFSVNCSFLLFSQIEENPFYRVEIDKVLINGSPFKLSSGSDLLISQSDSISFYYVCKTNGDLKSPFLFNIMLKNRTDSSKRTINSKVTSYFNLAEDNYEFTISAFDPQHKWQTIPITIKFKVNNNESKLTKELNKLKNSKSNDILKVSSFNPLSMIIGIVVGAGILLILFYFFKDRFFGKVAERPTEIFSNNLKEEAPKLTKENFDKALAERANLRSEIASLRAQIDSLQSRGYELGKQNKKLEEKVERLANSKKELEQLQTQKDELFTVIIHEIKNPVSLIKSLVELLRSYDLTTAEQHDVIDDIFKTTSKIVSLSQEVSKILSLETSNMSLHYDEVDLNEIVGDVVRRNMHNADKKQIKLLFIPDRNLPSIKLDIQKIDYVIDNLISNAIKFTQNGGKVAVTAKREDKQMVVEINDNGQGLSEQDVKLAFQRGAKLSAKPTADENSTGLGLWIVKKLVEAHNGRVWVKSALGKGSTFAISIPIIK